MILAAARVFVRDVVEAKRFYAQTLALPLKADGTKYGYCVFQAGSTEFVVEQVAENAPDEEQVLVGRFTGLSFAVPNAQDKYRELLAAGVAFTGAPEKQSWGGTLATLRDPAGNEIQVVEYPVA